jgi:hypothetical protein
MVMSGPDCLAHLPANGQRNPSLLTVSTKVYHIFVIIVLIKSKRVATGCFPAVRYGALLIELYQFFWPSEVIRRTSSRLRVGNFRFRMFLSWI